MEYSDERKSQMRHRFIYHKTETLTPFTMSTSTTCIFESDFRHLERFIENAMIHFIRIFADIEHHLIRQVYLGAFRRALIEYGAFRQLRSPFRIPNNQRKPMLCKLADSLIDRQAFHRRHQRALLRRLARYDDGDQLVFRYLGISASGILGKDFARRNVLVHLIDDFGRTKPGGF